MQWQPWETAPKDGKPFLATWSDTRGDRYVQPVRWLNGQWLHTWDHGQLQAEPTHWMPLPTPPATPAPPRK